MLSDGNQASKLTKLIDDSTPEDNGNILPNTQNIKNVPVFFNSLMMQESDSKQSNNQGPPPPPSFWQVEYYKEYFDISTETAINRIKKALWPFSSESFIESEPKPDLYIPLWIYITLIITMSTFGSIVHAIHMVHSGTATKLQIDLDPNRITSTATILLFYLVINPCIFYGILHYKGAKIKLAELLCIYGYSYIPFIPMSLLFAIQIKLFQVIVLFGAAGISTYFLYRNMENLCNNYLQNWMACARPYTIILQILLMSLIYLKIYN